MRILRQESSAGRLAGIPTSAEDVRRLASHGVMGEEAAEAFSKGNTSMLIKM